MNLTTGTAEALKTAFPDLWVEEAATPALMPASPEDVMQIVLWCKTNGWRVLPAGSGHSYPKGFHVPSGVVTLLSLHRDGISQPDPADLVVEAESGVAAKKVADVVAEAGFRLDEWPSEYEGTTGGLLCGKEGPGLRHLLLGVDVVDGRGRSLRFGGRVRKNVSGFDIAGFMLGSQGKTAWLDRVYLRLTPSGAPAISRTEHPVRTTPRSLSGLALRVSRALDPDDVFLKSDA